MLLFEKNGSKTWLLFFMLTKWQLKNSVSIQHNSIVIFNANKMAAEQHCFKKNVNEIAVKVLLFLLNVNKMAAKWVGFFFVFV